MCFQEQDGNFLFPKEICKQYDIYRDNANLGTYYFLKKLNPQEEIHKVIHKFSIVDNQEDLSFEIIYKQIKWDEDINEFNKIHAKVMYNSSQLKKIDIEDISEPYQCRLANMVFSLNQK